MYTQSSIIDTSLLADMGLLMSFLLILLIGLVIGLIMGSREVSIVGNIVCGMVGAVLLGGLCIMFFRDFYGVPGSLAVSIFGAVLFMMIKRGLTTY